jgi:hypothetical protein
MEIIMKGFKKKSQNLKRKEKKKDKVVEDEK